MSTIDQAFILAAGYGTRMRPLTDSKPKPLMEVNGKTLLSHGLDLLKDAGVRKVVINTHYLAEQIVDHVAAYSGLDIHTIYEPELLDTGGGLKNGLSYFNDEPFYVLSGDGFWENPPHAQSLLQLSDFWDSERMDILLLLQHIDSMSITKGVGDYDMNSDGILKRTPDHSGAFMFTSARIHHPRIFEHTESGAFSYLALMDKAEKDGRLYGIAHEGQWHHISTPIDLSNINRSFRKQEKRPGE